MAKDLINVSCDLRGFNDWSAYALGVQIPFATARALTRVGRMVRDEGKALVRKRFKVQSNWVPGGIQQVTADKKDWPSNCHTEVGSRAGYMLLQETGGTKTAAMGAKPLRVPQNEALLPITARGVQRVPLGVPKPLRPKRVLEGKRGWITDTGTLKLRAPDSFGPQQPPKTLFFLKQSAHIRKRFGFIEKSTALARKHYGDTFVASMTLALKPRK